MVTTIVYNYPLLAQLTSRFLIRDEKFSTRTVIGSTLVVLGVVIITLL